MVPPLLGAVNFIALPFDADASFTIATVADLVPVSTSELTVDEAARAPSSNAPTTTTATIATMAGLAVLL
jgi:hypothetical protein